MSTIYLQPEYFGRFRCTGPECPETCCRKWRIDWVDKEIEKLRNTECSEKLRTLIDSSFENVKGALYSVSLKDNGECPFHDEEGLCMIQKELGEKYLSATCQEYPRLCHKHGSLYIRHCVSSCPAVLDMLFSEEKCAALEQVRTLAEHKDSYALTRTWTEEAEKRPMLINLVKLTRFFCELIGSNIRPLSSSLVLGAIAADKFDRMEKNKNLNEFDKTLDSLKLQFSSPGIDRSLNQIGTNYEIKFKLVNNMLVRYFGESYDSLKISALHDGKKVIAENYREGLRKFSETVPDFALRNLAANIFLDCRMPFYDLDKSIFENYIFFASVCACFELISSAIGFTSDNIRDDYIKKVSYFCRSVSNSKKHASLVMEDMKNIGISSPAHIALITK